MDPPPLWFRLLTAGSLALFVGGALVAALGFAGADDGPPDGVPSALQMPEARVGDRGSYTLTLVRNTAAGPVIEQEEHLRFTFHWLEPEVQRDVAGNAHLVNRMHKVPWAVNEDGEWQRYAEPVYGFEVATGRMVSYSYLGEHRSEDGSQENRMRTTFYLDDKDLHVPPCGFNPVDLGARLDLSGLVTPYTHCSWDAYWTRGKTFRAQGVQELGGMETVFFTRADRGQSSTTHLWLSEDLPYPVRIATEDQNDPGLFHVLRLTAFERGTQPLASTPGPAASLPPAPELRFASPEPWGMPEEGLDHPFPLSRAYQDALEHPDADGLRRFLEEHPDAWVVDAHYRLEYQDDDARHAWQMLWRDGPAGYAAQVALEPPEEDGVLSRLLPGEPTVTFESQERAGGHYMRPHDLERFLPEGMPTVASLMGRWQHYASPEHAHREPNTWSFTLACTDEACSRAYPRFQAGHDIHERNSPTPLPWPLPPIGGEPGSHWNLSLLEARYDSATGTSWTLHEWTHQQYGTGPSGGGPDSDPEGLTTLAVQYRQPVWTLPPGYAVAGAGLVGMMVAVVYLLWPSLKAAGLMGLFSRTREGHLLDHPARRAIHLAVESEPGIHYQAIVRATGQANGAVEHHLRKLAAAGLVHAEKGARYTCFYVRGASDRSARTAAPALKAEGARRLLRAVVEEPGLTAAEAARRIGVSRPTITYHMHRMEEAGLLRAQRSGGGVRLYPTGAAAKADAGRAG